MYYSIIKQVAHYDRNGGSQQNGIVAHSHRTGGSFGHRLFTNGVNVYHYLTYLLEKLPNDRMSDEELDRLAPWNEDVKAEIERRANDSNH